MTSLTRGKWPRSVRKMTVYQLHQKLTQLMQNKPEYKDNHLEILIPNESRRKGTELAMLSGDAEVSAILAVIGSIPSAEVDDLRKETETIISNMREMVESYEYGN